MPRCGSQIILCDVPIRFDTYEGCSHACQYCFANTKRDISKVSRGESAAQLLAFINKTRTIETNWCDWNIPLHWGGMSDPFQPIEKREKRSLECLKIFAETQYPFIVSTKNVLIAEEPYLSLIKQCNCVVQFSAVCAKYDEIEKGASTFAQRVAAAQKISPYKRVNIRCQPYITSVKKDVIESIQIFQDAGVHGCIFEGIKYPIGSGTHKGMIKSKGDYVYPSKILIEHFIEFKQRLHARGMKFYCGENRLRQMSDELCCCGIEGLGWQENKANLNHFIFDKEHFAYTPQMCQPKTGQVFKCMHQTALYGQQTRDWSFKQIMDTHCVPKWCETLIPCDIKK